MELNDPQAFLEDYVQAFSDIKKRTEEQRKLVMRDFLDKLYRRYCELELPCGCNYLSNYEKQLSFVKFFVSDSSISLQSLAEDHEFLFLQNKSNYVSNGSEQYVKTFLKKFPELSFKLLEYLQDFPEKRIEAQVSVAESFLQSTELQEGAASIQSLLKSGKSDDLKEKEIQKVLKTLSDKLKDSAIEVGKDAKINWSWTPYLLKQARIRMLDLIKDTVRELVKDTVESTISNASQQVRELKCRKKIKRFYQLIKKDALRQEYAEIYYILKTEFLHLGEFIKEFPKQANNQDFPEQIKNCLEKIAGKLRSRYGVLMRKMGNADQGLHIDSKTEEGTVQETIQELKTAQEFIYLCGELVAVLRRVSTRVKGFLIKENQNLITETMSEAGKSPRSCDL